MSQKKEKTYVVAELVIKNLEIQPGRSLGTFRKEENATHAITNIARQQHMNTIQLGIFVNGKLIK